MPERGQGIEQFMWAYQHYFRSSTETSVRMVFEKIGFQTKVDVVLVGFRVAGNHVFDICVEPEDGPYSPDDLSRVEAHAEQLYLQHPEHDMVHSVRHVHDARHRLLRDEMRANALAEALNRHPASQGQTFFAGLSTRVGDYEVHVAVGVESAALAGVPRLHTTRRERFRISPSLVDAAIDEILHRARLGLYLPDAGANLMVLGVGSPEIVRSATERLVQSAFRCAGYWFGQDSDLLFSSITALPYEGRSGSGALILGKPDHPAIDVLLRIQQPVELRRTRAVRKLMEASGEGVGLLVGDEDVYGLGRVRQDYDATSETLFVVSVLGRGAWDLCHAGQALLSVRDGVARLPINVLDVDALQDVIDRLLPGADTATLISLARAAGENEHGAMLVVSTDADAEAQRLSPQAWAVEPVVLSANLLSQLTAMDGAVLVDPQGQCHAIGVILDGRAAGQGDPARGSRFNNAVRYLDTDPPPAVVIVYSADGSIDVFPRMNRRVRHETVEAAVRQYLDLAATRPPKLEHVSKAHDVVKSLEFYLSAEQCEAVNAAYAGVNEWRMNAHGMKISERELTPDPQMNDTYWLD